MSWANRSSGMLIDNRHSISRLRLRPWPAATINVGTCLITCRVALFGHFSFPCTRSTKLSTVSMGPVQTSAGTNSRSPFICASAGPADIPSPVCRSRRARNNLGDDNHPPSKHFVALLFLMEPLFTGILLSIVAISSISPSTWTLQYPGSTSRRSIWKKVFSWVSAGVCVCTHRDPPYNHMLSRSGILWPQSWCSDNPSAWLPPISTLGATRAPDWRSLKVSSFLLAFLSVRTPIAQTGNTVCKANVKAACNTKQIQWVYHDNNWIICHCSRWTPIMSLTL